MDVASGRAGLSLWQVQGQERAFFLLTFGSSKEGKEGFRCPHCAPEVHFRHLLVGLHAGELHLPKCRDACIVNQPPHPWTGKDRTWSPHGKSFRHHPLPSVYSAPKCYLFSPSSTPLAQSSQETSRVTHKEQELDQLEVLAVWNDPSVWNIQASGHLCLNQFSEAIMMAGSGHHDPALLGLPCLCLTSPPLYATHFNVTPCTYYFHSSL